MRRKYGPEFKRFDDLMTKLLSVPRSEIQKKLEEEKKAKAEKKKLKRKAEG